MIIHLLNNQVQLTKGRYYDKWSFQKEGRQEILYKNRYIIGATGYPLSLLSKGENVQMLPSMPKGDIVEYIVVIDVKGVQSSS